MLPLFISILAFTATASSHPLCPYKAPAARARMAPSARADMAGLGDVFGDFEIRFGKCLEVREGKEPILRFERGEIPWHAQADKQGRWTGLSFGPPRFPGDDSEKLRRDAKAAGAFLFAIREKAGSYSARGEEEQEVGENAHLLWLAEYRRQVEKGALKPATVVHTKGGAGLLTLGPLLSWPAGVPITVESAALLAFRSRDNLAADLLLEAIGGVIGKKAVESYATLARGTQRGWRHSPRALCEAALALKADPAFPEGLNSAEGRHRFYEFQGEFPATYSILHLSQEAEAGPWVCAAAVFPVPSSAAFTRARDFLDRAYDLSPRFPEEAPGSGK